ncbi:MAG TPA: hypothetical protein DEA80_17685, partial [Afipia sp.]|nr:hypothetical protein [Afipia sp.]
MRRVNSKQKSFVLLSQTAARVRDWLSFWARGRIVHQFTTTARFIRHRSDSVKAAPARMHPASGEADPAFAGLRSGFMHRAVIDQRDRAQDAGHRAPW